MNYIYSIVFHTPVGLFVSKVKEDSQEDLQKKIDYYSEPEKLTEGVVMETIDSIILIPLSVLKQSVIEFNFNV